MKRILCLIVCIILMASVVGCGKTTADTDNEVTKLYADGFTPSMSSVTDSSLKILFQKDYSFDVVYKVEAMISEAQYEQYCLASESDDSDAEIAEFLENLDNVVVSDITDIVPGQDKLNAYVGKTIGELENEGYENSGYSGDDGDYAFFYDGPIYSLIVAPESGAIVGSIDDYSTNDIRAMKIGSVEFCGFSFAFLDEID